MNDANVNSVPINRSLHSRYDFRQPSTILFPVIIARRFAICSPSKKPFQEMSQWPRADVAHEMWETMSRSGCGGRTLGPCRLASLGARAAPGQHPSTTHTANECQTRAQISTRLCHSEASRIWVSHRYMVPIVALRIRQPRRSWRGHDSPRHGHA